MAPAPFTALLPILAIAITLIVVSAVIIGSSRGKKTTRKSRYQINSNLTHQRYVPGQFSSQMELDMRLPYRRFKQLYPGSNITYDAYKKMQMTSAFRRSMSSQENKRMVR